MALYLIIERIFFWPLSLCLQTPEDRWLSITSNNFHFWKLLIFSCIHDIYAWNLPPFGKKNEWNEIFFFFSSYLGVLIEGIERLFFCLENSKISSNFINKLVSSHVLCACNGALLFILFYYFGLVYVTLGIKETGSQKKKYRKIK